MEFHLRSLLTFLTIEQKNVFNKTRKFRSSFTFNISVLIGIEKQDMSTQQFILRQQSWNWIWIKNGFNRHTITTKMPRSINNYNNNNKRQISICRHKTIFFSPRWWFPNSHLKINLFFRRSIRISFTYGCALNHYKRIF